MKASTLPTKEELISLMDAAPSNIWELSRTESSIDGDYDLVPIPNNVCVGDALNFTWGSNYRCHSF